jgi:hypothetical protein
LGQRITNPKHHFRLLKSTKTAIQDIILAGGCARPLSLSFVAGK